MTGRTAAVAGDAAAPALIDEVRRLERSMLTSWPALATAYDGDWVVRFANGYTKRANSVTCLAPDDADLDRRIDRIETLYQERGLTPVFRLSPLASPALEPALHERGWRRFDETVVMTADLTGMDLSNSPETADRIDIREHPDQAWLLSCQRIGGSGGRDLETLSMMLERLVPPAGYGRLGADGRIDAMGLVVVDDTLAGLFDVMTVSAHRRKGLAQALIRELFAWASKRQATMAWLSVLADNLPAVRLYRSLGFEELYRYHHRSKG